MECLILILADQLSNLHFTHHIAGFSTATTAYTTTNEVSSSGTNYTAGGNTLTNNGVAIASNIGYVDFADLTFTSVTLTADGALIYKGTTNEAVLVLDLAEQKLRLTEISLFSFQLLILLMQSLDLATRNKILE